MRRELVTGCTLGGYDQFETSPEAIDQELRPAVCERRQTDRLKGNYSIDYYLHSATRVTYQSLAMPLHCRDTSADRPRNEIEGEEGETAATRNGKIAGSLVEV